MLRCALGRGAVGVEYLVAKACEGFNSAAGGSAEEIEEHEEAVGDL